MKTQARITDQWIPVPDRTLRELGWDEGDILELEPAGDTLIVTRLSARIDGVTPPARPAPSRARPMPTTGA